MTKKYSLNEKVKALFFICNHSYKGSLPILSATKYKTVVITSYECKNIRTWGGYKDPPDNSALHDLTST